MEGLMFSTPMIISPVDIEPRVADVELIEDSVTRECFVSEMEPILEPYEGMEFESEDAARAFYNAYAAQIGFKVRVSSFIRSKRDNTIISRQLVCSREGFRSNKDPNNEKRSKRPRIVTRVGCRAMIMVKKQSSGRWVISKCEKIHNHVLGTEGKVVMLDYDPYVRDDEVMENPNGGDSNAGGIIKNSLGMIVVPPEGVPSLEPREGMEFESENDAQVFYKAYARHVGFRARVSSYYRSKRDNSIISRLIVCSKEGFRAKKDEKDQNAEEKLQRPRAITRVGCKAMIMVKKRDSGKWIVSKFVKNHNHALTPRTASDDERSEAEDDEMFGVEKALVASEVDTISEPYVGMEFESEEASKIFYFAYSRQVGFNMRVSTYYRSKRDKLIISRLFVCSKEGFYVKKDVDCDGKIKRSREATRVGCKAMLMVKQNSAGKWVVSKFEKEHNHTLGPLRKMHRLRKRKRLTGNVRSPKNKIVLHKHNGGRESPTSRYNNLCHEAIKYAEAGSASADVYNVAIRALREAVEKVAAIKEDVLSTVVCEGNVEGGVNLDSRTDNILPPNERPKIRAQSLNYQSKASFKKNTSRLRFCNVCKQPSDHTSRSCPTKQAGSRQQVNIVPGEAVNAVSGEPITESNGQTD